MPRLIRRLVLPVAGVAAIALPATAGASVLTSPTGISFGSQPVGSTSAPQSVTLIARCDGAVVPGICTIPVAFLPAVATTGDFAQTNTCPALLSVLTETDATCGITVTFRPTAVGSRSGSLSTGTSAVILTPGPTVALTGVGVAASGSNGGGNGPGTGTASRKKCKKPKHKKHRRSAQTAKKKCKKHRKHKKNK